MICTLNLKIYLGAKPPDPQTVEGLQCPSPDSTPSALQRFAPTGPRSEYNSVITGTNRRRPSPRSLHFTRYSASWYDCSIIFPRESYAIGNYTSITVTLLKLTAKIKKVKW